MDATDPKTAARLQQSVKPSTSGDGAPITNPYMGVLSEADEKLQDIELHKKAWNAPVPTREEAARSLSLPTLSSPAAKEARSALGEHSSAATSSIITGGAGAMPQQQQHPHQHNVAVTAMASATADLNLLVPGANETFTAAQVRLLETEVSRLRETVDILLEARGVKGTAASGRAAVASVMSGLRTTGGATSPSASKRGPSSLRPSDSTGEFQNTHTGPVGDTLREKKKHDQRVVALQKESNRLRDPHRKAASTTSAYKRINDNTLGIKKVDPNPAPSKPLDIPSAASPPPSDTRRRASRSATANNNTQQGSSSRRVSSANTAADVAAAATAAADEANQEAGLTSSKTTSSSKKVSSSSSSSSRPSTAPLHKATLRTRVAQNMGVNANDIDDVEADILATASANPNKKKASASLAENLIENTRSVDSSKWAAKAKHKSIQAHKSYTDEGVEEDSENMHRTTGRPSTAGARLSMGGAKAASKQQRKNSISSVKEFSFLTRPEKPMSIVQAKFLADYDAKLEAEEAAMTSHFKAMPIAPATKDLGLYNRILVKLEHRREALHAARSAKLAANFQPFTIVTQHCDEHAARQAARKAKFELEQQRELAESRKFHAIPVPSSTQNPDSMFFDILKREAERPGRLSANARALAATAALPPRMQLANENERRRKAEREAKRAEEEKIDKAMNRFRPNSLPDFDGIYKTFEDSLVAARSAAGTTRVDPFAFDQPERIQQDLARKEKWIREYELETSQSMALRRRSTAYLEGVDLTGDGGGKKPSAGTGGGHNAKRRASTASAMGRSTGGASTGHGGGSISAALAVNRAPPAAMTRSVQLKMFEVQRKLRESQQKQLEEVEADEAFRSFIKASTAKFAPIVQDMEKSRVPIPLAWQMDKVSASTSATRKAFEDEARARAKANKARVLKAQESRPLVMMAATLQREKEKAHVEALHRIAATSAQSTGQGSNWRGVVTDGVGGGQQIFDEDEKELLGYPGADVTGN